MKRLTTLFLYTFAVTIFTASPLVHALPQDDIDAIYWDSVHYKIPTGSTGCGNPDGTLTGYNNAERVWNFLIAMGLTPIAVAGIMGNFNQESSLDPAVKQNHTTAAIPDGGDGKTGFGLAQWTSQNRQAALFEQLRVAGLQKYYGAGFGNPEINKTEIPPEDVDKLLQVELLFAWEGDSTKIRDLADELNAATSVQGDDGSTAIFHKKYERSADSAAQIQERIDDADKFLSKFGGGGSDGIGCDQSLGGVSSLEDGIPWAMKFIEDTKEKYNGAPKATARLLGNKEVTGVISGAEMSGILVAEWPEASSEFICWQAYGCDECVTASVWFVAAMTDYGFSGRPGNGRDVVNTLEGKGIPTGKEPKPFSIFSTAETAGSAGHTGIVLGVLEGGQVITLENNFGANKLQIFQYDIKKAYSDVEFAYVGDKLKVDGINPGGEDAEQ